MRCYFRLVSLFAVCSTVAAPFQLVSVRDASQAPPAGGSGDSWTPILSPDGRFVLFASAANNIALNSSSNALTVAVSPTLNVFLRDRTNGTTTLINVNLSGTGGGNRDSLPSALSSDGHYALFESGASDIFPGDTNGLTDVFLRDVWSNVTVLVSVGTNGGVANGVCRGSTMTPDGLLVAFTSAANNLVTGDTNGIADVFVRDWQGGTTRLVSAGARPYNPYSSPVGSESPDISADGRFVAFYSTATNLVAGVTNSGEVYLRDLVGGTTVQASIGAHALLPRSTVCFNHMLSADGKFVAYEACTNPPPGSFSARGLILRYSLDTGLTDTVHTNAYVPTADLEDIHTLDMSPDGRFIAFIANTNTAGTTCVYLWDAQAGAGTLVSGDLSGHVAANAICEWPAVDPSGRFVAFLSSASGLVSNALNGTYHLYMRDIQAGTTTLVDVDTNGVGSGVSPGTMPHMTADAALVAFESADANLVANDRNHNYDVFVSNIAGGTAELISARDASLPSASPNSPSVPGGLCCSADGRWAAFASEADNLVPGHTNGFRDIFVRDLFGGSNLLASVSTNGGAADAISTEPSLSADTRFVAFSSAADNLVAGDSNRAQDVFIRALPSGPTLLVSLNMTGTSSGNGFSESPQVSATGRYVLFRSKATNLAPGTFSSGSENLFVRDMQAAATYALTFGGLSSSSMTPDGHLVAFGGLNSASMTPDGRLVAFADISGAASGTLFLWDSQVAARVETNSIGLVISSLSLSPDGGKIVCFAGTNPPGLYLFDRIARTNGLISTGYPIGSRIGLRFSADGRFLTFAAAPTLSPSFNQVYVYDFQTRTKTLVSAAFGSTQVGSGGSDWPDISADGRFVAYRSAATNLLAVATSNNVPNLFLYDRLAHSSSLLSVSRVTGGPGDNRSAMAIFSADGRTLFFQSWASDLVPMDFNHAGDVFSLAFLYASTSPGSSAVVGPTLTWPSRPGETYRVQFKDNLGDPSWQDVSGTVTVTGNQASLTDTAPAVGQRFYRVVAN